MKKIFILFISIILLCGCNNNSTSIEEIMKKNEYIIIDVRTKEEYEESHIVDSINIPYDQLRDNLDKDKVIFVYCKSGNRSKIAFDTLTNLGYTVYDLGAFDKIDMPKE